MSSPEIKPEIEAEVRIEPLKGAAWAARVLGVNLQSLYALVRRGLVPAVKLGSRSVRFDPAAIRAFIAKGGRWTP